MCECLQCYACSGRDECGISFSPNSSTTKKVQSQIDGFFDVCSITVDSEGITTRALMLSYRCKSSPYQFCCKEDWCNYLPSPPLPALTSLKCKIDHCSSQNNKCEGTSYVATLSSATESCMTIIGVEGQDPLTNISYSAFTIRTIIAHCENQSLGIVSYGGATFRGRINCCWTNLCNVESESS
ncbi:unnamed protein product [Rotaria sp. Silwood1]|nr:unnamed protein product [Rotaria sp. Silwood1]